MKNVLIISDLHCGHQAGLTPPAWRSKDGQTHLRDKAAKMQDACWNWYSSELKKCGKFDAIICNGDAIDGRGSITGGTEMLTTDRSDQADMAKDCIRQAMSRNTKVIMTHGSQYHVSADGEDWESVLADRVGAEKIGSHEWVEIEGITLDVKHHCGSSGVPHGRFTALGREHLWSTIWKEAGMTPSSNVIIRSHVHYFGFCGDGDYLAITTPPLQGPASKYGSRRCSGIVHYGFITMQITGKTYTWQPHLLALSSFKVGTVKV